MFKIIKLDRFEDIKELSLFFHKKWGVPLKAYVESMEDSLKNNGVPAWYYVKNNDEIIAGIGVIDNDFHKRKDLTPNLCALYVKKEYTKNGIAKSLLNFACNDLKRIGINNVYLITSHTQFYEKCGFVFLDMIEENDGSLIRCYHRAI